MARFTRSCALVLVLAAAAACSDDSPSSENSSLPADVTVRVGEKGGTLRASGVTLEIPEGALDKTIKISAKNAGQSAPKEINAKQVSDLYEFGPAGTKFNKDVKVTFHTEKSEPRGEVYFTTEDGSGFEKIASQKEGQTVTAFVKHFSQGFVGVPLDEELDGGMDLDGGLDMDDATAVMDVDAEVVVDAEEMSAPDTGGNEPLPDAGVAVPSDGGLEAAVDAGIPSTRITVRSHDRFGALVNQTWAAFQDGQGAWQALAPSAQTGVYEMDVTSDRFGVAFVCSSKDLVSSWGTLSFEPATSTTLDVITQGPPCDVAAGPAAYNLEGTLTLGTDQYWRVGHAHLTGSSISFSTVPAPFNLGDLRHNEANDVLFASGPSTAPYAISRILVRRDVTLTASMTGYNADMVKDGVNPLGTAQAQVLNANDATYVDVRYLTRNTEDGLWLNTSTTSGTSTRVVSFATLPESVRRSSDRYLLLGLDSTSAAWRSASLATYATGDLSVMLPPAFATTFSALNAPYLRPSYAFTPVAGADLYTFSQVYSPLRTSTHTFTIEVDPTWLQGTGSQTLTFPDFSQVQGFEAAWVAPSAGSVSAKASVHVSKSDAAGLLKSESGQSATVTAP